MPAPKKGCTPRARGIQLFGNAPRPCQQDLGEKVLRRFGLPLSGYKLVLQNCDSLEIAYMLCSINATPRKVSLVLSRNIVIGFILLPVGVLITPLVPEFGLPLIILSTRFLKEKYGWAERVNSWAEAKLQSVRNWFRKNRNK